MRSFRPARAQVRRFPLPAFIPPSIVEQLESRVLLSSSVLSFRNDGAQSGVDSTEIQLTPANVKAGSFGKLFSVAVDGAEFGQPLIDAGVTIAGGVNTTSGVSGVHNVAFVATENDSVYAIDADNGQILWKRNFCNASNSGGDINNTLGATSIKIVTSSDVSSPNLGSTLGITSTPIIDPNTGTLYVVAETKEVIGGKTYIAQRLHGIRIADGTDVNTPYLLGATTGTNTNNTQIWTYGKGNGAIVDPYLGTGKMVVQYNALRSNQRVALNLVDGNVYIATASNSDIGPYHGWVISVNVSNVATSGFKLSGVLNTAPNEGLTGVWEGGGGLAFDPDGSGFYFMTGNGYVAGGYGEPTLDASGFPVDADYDEAVIKAAVDPSTSSTHQGPNGWGLKVVDYFIPHNVAEMDQADSDFGSGAPLLLPASAGIPGHPNLLIAGGKDGRVFVLDRDHLGHYNATNDAALNSVPDGSGHMSPPDIIAGTLSTPTYFDGKLYLQAGYAGRAAAYTISSTGKLVASSQPAVANFGELPGGAVVSSNGTTNGIVWYPDHGANVLRAYDANTLSTELWDSNDVASDKVGAIEKFAEPTIADGKVYVGAINDLVVYGLKQAPTQAPSAPVLAAKALSASSINLTWTDSSAAANKPSVYLIDQSTNGGAFTQVATAPAGATSIAIGGLAALTTYSFEVAGVNSKGQGAFSDIAKATTTNQASGVDFSGGFAGTSQLTLNGKAALSAAALQLTGGAANQASSAFFTSPVGIANFTSSFTFKSNASSTSGEGFTFTLQNVAANALGSSGAGLGYGGIAKSVAIKFDLYSDSGEGTDSTGLYTDGATPTSAGSINLSSTAINFHDGDTFRVDLAYTGATLTETITDTTTNKSVAEKYTVNIAGVIGGNSAWVGFTASTGAATSTQDILAWTFSPSASTSPNAPTGLGATPATATSVNLTWTNNATNQTGYHLDRATDPAFTQNLITQTLPASPNSFTDTAAGLAPGNTFYYRLRAFNAAGDSGDTNAASVAIPDAPPTPTDASITLIKTNEIDLAWTDNAGHLATSYEIQRSTNGGVRTTVASLPPTSRDAPSGYSWNDTSVTPGNKYDYHIVAVNSSGNNDFAGANAETLTLAPVAAAGPGNNLVTLSWAAVQGAVSYNVYRATAAGAEAATPVATGITATSWQDKTAKNGTKYYYKVTAVNANASQAASLPSESARSVEVSATPGAAATGGNLFSKSVDIGAPKLPGSSSFANGVYTVTGEGIDIYNNTDQFHYDYASVTGNTTIAATVSSVQNVNSWAKAGVMFRDGAAANAAFADIVVTPGGYLSFQWRSKAGGATSKIVLSGKTAPQSVKLVRNGNVFTAYYSVKGIWTQIGGGQTIAMGATVTTGLAVTSINIYKTCTATFSNVSLG
ncbi:MAG TPA: fibronectin type III domain-containing protein [Tepidisphaeraceae bacterium]|jgi:fibronectin type 3 domain-containing protein|nr:fibronectin type III domain-containing protein [Tepidisphaeraceae bacterium]